MERIFKKEFWNKACARALRTFLQGLLVGLEGCAFLGEINWAMIFSGGAVGVIASFATSIIAGLPEDESR